MTDDDRRELVKMRKREDRKVATMLALTLFSLTLIYLLTISAISFPNANAEVAPIDRAFTGRAHFVQGTAFVIECETDIAINEINPRTVLIGCAAGESTTDNLTE